MDGIIVSNYRGRQLRNAPPTIVALFEAVAAVDITLDIFLNGIHNVIAASLEREHPEYIRNIYCMILGKE